VASVIDTSPTILDLLGLPIPTAFQGSSLLDPTERMALLFTDYSIGFFGLRDGDWRFIDEPGASRQSSFSSRKIRRRNATSLRSLLNAPRFTDASFQIGAVLRKR
jgi:hypothetical protein